MAYAAYAAGATPRVGTAYALHADRQGSIIAVTDQSTCTVTARYEYDAFGSRTVLSGAGLQDYGFTGREFDAETGLYNYRARHYDPHAGRFLQSDPLGFAAGDLNLCAYTWNDPANWTDPSGLTTSGAEAAAISTDPNLRLAQMAITGATVCAAGRVATLLVSMGELLAAGADFSQMEITEDYICAVKATAPLPIVYNNPPGDAKDPNGAKAPGKPGEAEGFKDPKSGEQWVPNPNGRGNGWLDKKGNVWVPTGPLGPGSSAHGGPHWDVQGPRGGYGNVYPGGRRR